MVIYLPPDMILVSDRSRVSAGFRVQSGDDWPVLRTSHANMLVCGPRDATHAFILAVTPDLRVPVRDCSAVDALPSSPAEGTLILRDVDALDGEQQLRLLRWLDDPRNGRTQVISTTAELLYAAVQTGTFSDWLYYRLNVVHVRVSGN